MTHGDSGKTSGLGTIHRAIRMALPVLAVVLVPTIAMASVLYTDGSVDPTTNNALKSINGTPTNKADDIGVGKFGVSTGEASPPANVAATFSTITDAAAADGKAFRFTDADNTTRSWYNSVNNSGASLGLNFTTAGTTIAMKFRLESASGVDSYMGINSGTTSTPGIASHLFWNNSTGLVKEVYRNVSGTSTATGNTYHVFRISAQYVNPNRLIKVYVDENATPVINITNGTAAWSNQVFNAWTFGIFGSAGTGTYVVDWIAGTDDGVFAPGTTNNFNSLITSVLQAPEPATLGLLALGLLLPRRRRQARQA